MHKRLQIVACSAILISILVSPAKLGAQTILDFKRVNLIWPTVELYFSASRDSLSISGVLKEQLTVTENGVEVRDFILHPPKPLPCPMLVALVLDASGSMEGAGNAGLKAGATAFVERMDGIRDQVALVKFATTPSLMLAMTTDTAALKDTIQTLPASGATTVWDGIWMGLDQVITGGINDCKAVVVVTDGGDGSSTHWPGVIIPRANTEHIRVYTIGLGNSINVTELDLIGMLTGGRFFHTPDPAMLPAIFDSIATLIKGEAFGDRVISYVSRCPDGTLRTVELDMYSPDSTWRGGTKYFRAPKDIDQYQPFPVRLVGASVQGGMPVTMQIVAVDAFTESLPVRLKVVFPTKTDALSFDSAWAPVGSPLAEQPFIITRYPDSTVVSMSKPAKVSGAGTILLARYISEVVSDTICDTLSLIALDPGTGCLRIETTTTPYCLLPSCPAIRVTSESTPEFVWNASLGSYQPSSAELRFRVENIGTAPAEAPVYMLSAYVPNLKLLAPAGDMQAGSSPQLSPGVSDVVIWLVEPLRRRSTDTIRVSLACNFSNSVFAFAEGEVILHSSLPDLRCELSIPEAEVDSTGSAFEPLPVLVTVYNEGGDASDSVNVRLVLSGDIALHPTDPGQLGVGLVPPIIQPGGQGSASWLLALPVDPDGAFSAVVADVLHGEDEVRSCVSSVEIPPLDTMRRISISIVGRTILCPSESTTLTAESGYTSYRWSCGDTTRAITVTSGGKYLVDAVDALGVRRFSQPIFIAVSTLPDVRVYASSYEPCEGDTVRVYSYNTFPSYRWNTGDSVKTIDVTRSGLYEVTVMTVHGCSVKASRLVTFRSIPPTPTIYRSFDTLFANVVADRYTWYRNGQQISADTSFCVARVTGLYTMEASNGGKCKSMSPPFEVAVLDVPDAVAPSSLSMRLWPDPVSEKLTIEIDSSPGEAIRLTLVDFLGRSRTLVSDATSSAVHRVTLPVAQLPSGQYLLVLHSSGRQIVQRFRKL